MNRRLAVALVLLYACSNNPTIVGEEIGRFTFNATAQVSNDCPFAAAMFGDAAVLFSFDAILSHSTTSTKAYMLLGNVQRDAGFDGLYFVSEHAAPRQFAECGTSCDKTTVDETIQLAVLSRTQDEALGSRCPPNPLDGGVPPPDGGVLPPHPIPGGFDAVRACGELLDVVIPDGGSCSCTGCTMVFQVEGTPKGGAR